MATLTEADRAAERILADIPAKTIATTDGPRIVPRPWENYLVARFGTSEAERMLGSKVGTTNEGAGEDMPKTEKKPVVKREGKFKFIKALIAKGTHTKSEIVALTAKQFPAWEPKLVECAVYSSRTQMRKAGATGDWLPEPVAAPEPAPQNAPETGDEERPHITQHTEVAAS